MSKRLFGISTWLGMFILFSLILSPSVIAQVQDVTPPSILEFTFTPIPIDVSAGSQVVTFTLRITDDAAGFDLARFYVWSPSEKQLQSANVYSNDRISGDGLDGTYRVCLTFTEFSEAGTWFVSSVFLKDAVGNSRIYLQADLINMGFSTELEVY